MRDFIPHDYQYKIIDHIINTNRCCVYAGMGLGKTSSSLTAIEYLSLLEDIFPVLVIAPLRVAQSTWPEEALKWNHTKHLRVSPIVGSAKERKAVLKAQSDIFTINYENLPWLMENIADWPFRMVIADESTKLKSFRLRQGSVRAKALAKVAHKSARFVELSGTPSPNGLQDLWGQLWFIDKGLRLGKSFDAFKSRWFQSIQVGADRHAIQLKPLPHAQNEIETAIGDVCLSLNAADYFDIQQPIVVKVEVELPPAVRKLYKDMEREMFLEINLVEVEAFNAAAKTMKCLQLANGAIYTDDKQSYEVVHDAKIQALDEIIEGAAGMPVLVAYHFKSDLERLLKAFPKGKQLDKDPKTIKAWNDGKIPVMFAHPASAGHGLNLQDGGNILAFFGHNWNLEEYQQIIERIGPTRQAQAGHNRPVFIYHIVAKNTIDEVVMERRETKREVQDLLLEALKRKV